MTPVARRWIGGGAGALLVVLALLWQRPPPEPSHAGRPLGAWLEDLLAGRDGAQHEQAREALHSLGARAVPALVRRLGTTDPRWRSWLAALPVWLPWRLSPSTAGERRAEAERALLLLGPVARDATPELRALLRRQPSNASAHVVLAALGASGQPVGRELQQPPATVPTNAPQLASLLGEGTRAITTPVQWAGHRAELERAWTQFLGEFPREKAPLAPEFLKQEELPKFTRLLVTYQIEDGVRTDAMLLTPRGASGRLPAIVLFHPTYSNHYARAVGLEGDDPERHQAVQLVERGYVVLAPRCFIWAELPTGYQRKGESLYVANVRRMQERHPTWKGMTRMTWDGIRALDFLVTLPGVDTNRIGLFGHSLGAKEVVYVAALDPRPRCVVSSEGGIGLRLSNWQDVWYLGPDIRAPGFAREHHELLALIAPRPFLLLAGGPGGGAADGDASWPLLEAAQPVYRLLGASNSLGWLHHGLGHRYGAQARDVAEAFLDRHLVR